MTTIEQAASEFLDHRRIAVTGVSRTPGSHGWAGAARAEWPLRPGMRSAGGG